MRNINPAAIVEKAESESSASIAQLMSQAVTPAKYARNIKYALESWPPELHDLSYPSQTVTMTQDEILLMTELWAEVKLPFENYSNAKEAWEAADTIIGTATYHTSDGTDFRLRDIQTFANLERRVDESIRGFQKVCAEAAKEAGVLDAHVDPFFRLGTASPKDSPFAAVNNGRVSSGAQTMLMLLTSERGLAQIANDEFMQKALTTANDPNDLKNATRDPERLAEARAIPPHLTHLWFRIFDPFERHAEFRCFMKDRQFLGASQYHQIISDPQGRYFRADPFPELVEYGPEYEKLIIDWFPKFAEASGMQDAVFDVVVDRKRGTTTLLEINPFDRTTFPGLMDWDNPSTFDGEVKWVGEMIEHIAPRVTPEQIERIKAIVSTTPPPTPYETLIPKPKVESIISKTIGRIFGGGGR